MKIQYVITLFILLLIPSAVLDAADFNIAAAISLKASLEQVTSNLQQAAGGKINISYGASGTLAAQIRQGMPVDLFISADRPTMEQLTQAKLIDENSVSVLVGNQLVLITPKTPRAGVNIQSFADLTGPSVQHVAIGEPKVVPAGTYAVQTLQYLKLYDTLAQNHTLIHGANVAQVLAYVVRDEVDAGLVYRSDALDRDDVRIIATAPAASHDPIVYMMGIPKEAKNHAAAEAVEKALLGDDVQKVFVAFGFTVAHAATQPAADSVK